VFDARGRYVRDRTPPAVPFRILSGEAAPAYARVRSPTVAVYAVDRGVGRDYPWVSRMVIGRGKAELQARRAEQAQREWEAHQQSRFRQALPNARVVEVPGASHHVFLSRPDLVRAEIRALLRMLGTPPSPHTNRNARP
jgi:pimeloyl-ACP methyl ester carboxylesterase